jgi:hypothetical protein
VDGPGVWRADLQRVISLADSKLVVLQEMGLSTDVDGSSAQLQADYLSTVVDFMMNESDQLRVLCWFLFHDPGPLFLEINREALAGLPPAFVDQFLASLSGLGFCTWDVHGCPTKASWPTLLASQQALRLFNTTDSAAQATVHLWALLVAALAGVLLL